MRTHLPRTAIAAALTTAGLLGAATTARAAVAVTYSQDAFSATGDAAADTITIKNGSTTSLVAIQVPGQVLADPDGAGITCTSSGDTAECQSGSVSIAGNAGNDVLADTRTFAGSPPSSFGPDFGFGFGFGSASLNGGDGSDTLTGGELSNSFEPGAGADRVRGGSAPTAPGAQPYKGFLADGGNPADFQSQFGPDSVRYDLAGAGVTVTLDDQANDGAPGEGDDIGSDIEQVSGTNANDTLSAGGAATSLLGNLGDDTLNGGSGDDSLNGGGFGADGGAGSDTLNGNGGNDVLQDSDSSPFQDPRPGDPARPPAGVDRLNGGAGDDALRADAGADDLVGGTGQDSADFERSAPFPATPPPDFVPAPIGFTISLDDQANDGATGAGEGDNVHSDVENVGTGSGPDVITGSAAPNLFFTGRGNDAVVGAGGADVIDTEDGDDSINVQDGITDRVDAGRGNDSAVADLPGGQPEKADVLLNVENVSGVPLAGVIDVKQIPRPAPANVAPVLSVSGLTVKTKSFLKKGTFTLKVTTNEPASVVADLLGKNRFRAIGDIVVGTGRLAPAAGVRGVKVSVGKSNLKTFKRKLRTKKQRRKGVKLRVRVVATDTLGLATTTTKTVTIKG
jgi:Ca2+-binding RTX toxin-like protein